MDLLALRDETLSTAQEITDPGKRAGTLTLLAAKIYPAEDRAEVLDLAIDAAREIEDLEKRAVAFAGVIIAAGK
jgi:hypothetical protein